MSITNSPSRSAEVKRGPKYKYSFHSISVGDEVYIEGASEWSAARFAAYVYGAKNGKTYATIKDGDRGGWIRLLNDRERE